MFLLLFSTVIHRFLFLYCFMTRSLKSMMSAFEHMGQGGGGGMGSDLENMLVMVQTDASEALRSQSANAIGRLHQVWYQSYFKRQRCTPLRSQLLLVYFCSALILPTLHTVAWGNVG
jgi:hypothetical protein